LHALAGQHLESTSSLQTANCDSLQAAAEGLLPLSTVSPEAIDNPARKMPPPDEEQMAQQAALRRPTSGEAK
jgi:hypothetical protein